MQKYRSLLEAILAYLIAILLPLAKLMFGIGILVVIDTITGIWAAKKKGEPITSRRLSHTMTKGLSYMLALIAGFIMQRLFMPEMEVIKIVAGLIAFIEVKSIDENFKTITGNSLLGSLINKK